MPWRGTLVFRDGSLAEGLGPFALSELAKTVERRGLLSRSQRKGGQLADVTSAGPTDAHTAGLATRELAIQETLSAGVHSRTAVLEALEVHSFPLSDSQREGCSWVFEAWETVTRQSLESYRRGKHTYWARTQLVEVT